MFFFFNIKLARIYLFIYFKLEFTIVVLKNLVFSTSKSYFIYFTISHYNTPNIKCSIFYHFI